VDERSDHAVQPCYRLGVILDPKQLDKFTGSESLRRYAFGIILTEGAEYVARNGDANGAFWPIDAIASHQVKRSVACEEFQAWRLDVHADTSATLTCEDGNGRVVVTQAIFYTDFDLPSITPYFENSIIYLPSER
jgi:hypothetical protein